MGMILTARHVSAKEGLELGFVNEVVPAGEALAAAGTLGRDDLQELADVDPRLQAGDPAGLDGRRWSRRSPSSASIPAVKAMAASQDYIEGPKAFSEKRPPKWLGQ